MTHMHKYSTNDILRAEDAAMEALDNRLNGPRIHRAKTHTIIAYCLLADERAVLELLDDEDVGDYEDPRLALARQRLTLHYQEAKEALTKAGRDDDARRLYNNDRQFYLRKSGHWFITGDSNGAEIQLFFRLSKKGEETRVLIRETPFTDRQKPKGEPKTKRKGTGAGAKPRAPESVADFATMAKAALSEDERVLLAGRLIREIAPEKRQALIQEITGELGFTIRRKPAKRKARKTGTK